LAGLPIDHQSRHDLGVAASGVTQPRRGATAHECFDHPEVAAADLRFGDMSVARIASLLELGACGFGVRAWLDLHRRARMIAVRI
jgi:hypothetical protein